MPTTAKGFRTPAGTDPLSQGDDAIRNLAADVDAFAGWVPVGGASGAVLAKTGAGDYAAAWAPPHYVPPGGAAAQVLAKASGADYDLAWTTPASGGSGGSSELDFAQLVADVTLSATAAPSAQTLITGAARAYDGATAIIVLAYLVEVQKPANSGHVHLTLWDLVAGVDLGEIATFHVAASTSVAGSAGQQMTGAMRLTPASGSHQYALKVWANSSGGTVKAGPGGAGLVAPGLLRVARA